VVAAAVTWRVLLLVLAVVAVGYVAGKLLLVVLPVIVALLLATLLAPLAQRLRDRGMHERAASLLAARCRARSPRSTCSPRSCSRSC
jgi:predicted PurR-regulated permease PerM